MYMRNVAYLVKALPEEVAGLFMFLLLLGCLLDRAWMRRRSGRHFAMWVGVAFLLLEADGALWLLGEIPGRPWYLRALLHYDAACSYWMYGACGICFADWIEETRPIPRWVRIGLMALPFLLCVCALMPGLNSLLMDYNMEGIAVYGPLYGVFNILCLMQSAILIAFVLYYHRALGVRDTLIVFAQTLVPTLANLVDGNNSAPTCVLLALSIFFLYISICQQRNRALSEAKQQLAETRLDSMVLQIQPHFIFNTLTAIRSLCKESPEARDALADFADYLRLNIDSMQSREPIAFTREMEHIRIYLRFEQMRFGQQLKIEEQLACTDFLLPALTVQPLVENAAKHGLRGKPGGGTIRIGTREDADGVHISVEDDGVGFDTAAPMGAEHVGLENVRQRLALACGGTLHIESTPGKGTRCEVCLPKGK